MKQNTLIQVRVNDDVKKEADLLFENLGLDTPTAIRIFLNKAILQHGIPFDIYLPITNSETIAAIEESDRISRDPLTKKYGSFSELLTEVQNEI